MDITTEVLDQMARTVWQDKQKQMRAFLFVNHREEMQLYHWIRMNATNAILMEEYNKNGTLTHRGVTFNIIKLL